MGIGLGCCCTSWSFGEQCPVNARRGALCQGTSQYPHNSSATAVQAKGSGQRRLRNVPAQMHNGNCRDVKVVERTTELMSQTFGLDQL